MKKFLYFLYLLFVVVVEAQQIQSPSEFLGYELGTKFTRHHRVVDYCEYLASTVKSMVKLQEYGQTYEDRPLILLFISSPENIRSIEDIRQNHMESIKGGPGSGKAFVWLSYNVHGNESVSTEAAMQTLYELLTSKKDYLDNSIVIIDPCINPDGRDRYVNWYNQVKNTPFQVDPLSREHHEGWHSGRSNHYMFDLNRDWAWLTQKESQQRLAVYNNWMPHIHVDFHEQGVDYPYFFAPAAEPFHEVITDFQREFQTVIGKNHAKYFDARGWFYFTKERFDLFYPSYGDTYPTYNGAVGMTYEQGGSGRAGLGIITKTADTLTLRDRIDHHLTTGLSTVEVSSENAEKLNLEFTKFFQPKKYRYKSYIMKGKEDHIKALTSWLDKHGIEYGSGTGSTVKGYRYRTAKTESFKSDHRSLVISTDQTKGTLVKVLFEPEAKLSDSLTYDITAWSLPYAYGLDALASESYVVSNAYESETETTVSVESLPYAFIANWDSMQDARFLSALLQQGIRVRSAQVPFQLDGRAHARGSLIITREDNKNLGLFKDTLIRLATKYNIELVTTGTGFVDSGRDMGSGHVKMIRKPRIAILSGKPTSTSNFGELWHFFEQQLQFPMIALEASQLESTELTDFDMLILPNGNTYGEFLDDDLRTKLNQWVDQGGKLLVIGGAIKALSGKDEFGIKARELSKDSTRHHTTVYERTARERLKEDVKGAIFKTKVDPTHPLAFGYDDVYYTLKIKNGSYEYLTDGGNVVIIENDTKPVAGFSGSETKSRLKNSLVFGVESIGEGQVIYMVDNPLFRGFWENGKLFMANAIFMVH